MICGFGETDSATRLIRLGPSSRHPGLSDSGVNGIEAVGNKGFAFG